MSAALSRGKITAMEWRGRNALLCVVTTPLTDHYAQIYAGRRLVGIADYAGSGEVMCQVEPTHCPPPIQVVMVDDDNRSTDYGSKLPRRPFNRHTIQWSAGNSDDAKWFGLYKSEADEALDQETQIARVRYLGEGTYSHEFPAVEQCGEFTYGVTTIDDAAPDGNESDPDELAIDAGPYPPDVAIDDNEVRLTTSINAGVLSVAFTFEWTPA